MNASLDDVLDHIRPELRINGGTQQAHIHLIPGYVEPINKCIDFIQVLFCLHDEFEYRIGLLCPECNGLGVKRLPGIG